MLSLFAQPHAVYANRSRQSKYQLSNNRNVTFQGGLRVQELALTFEAPAEKTLHIYPSPFRDVLNIGFQISEPAYMQARIADAYGREVWDHTSSRLSPGWHQLEWKAEEAQGGIYLVSLYQNGRRVASSRALLIR